jgi:hypothetical protein
MAVSDADGLSALNKLVSSTPALQASAVDALENANIAIISNKQADDVKVPVPASKKRDADIVEAKKRRKKRQKKLPKGCVCFIPSLS